MASITRCCMSIGTQNDELANGLDMNVGEVNRKSGGLRIETYWERLYCTPLLRIEMYWECLCCTPSLPFPPTMTRRGGLYALPFLLFDNGTTGRALRSPCHFLPNNDATGRALRPPFTFFPITAQQGGLYALPDILFQRQHDGEGSMPSLTFFSNNDTTGRALCPP